MPVLRVGERQPGDQWLVPGHDRVEHMLVHQLPRSLELSPFNPRILRHQRIHPFVMDARGPPPPEQIGSRQLHQEIAQRERVEHARIEHDRECVSHAASLIPNAEPLPLTSELI